MARKRPPIRVKASKNASSARVRSSRLALTWANGVWLLDCSQVRRLVPTFVLAA